MQVMLGDLRGRERVESEDVINSTTISTLTVSVFEESKETSIKAISNSLEGYDDKNELDRK